MSSKELEVGQAGDSRVAKQEMGCLAALAIIRLGQVGMEAGLYPQWRLYWSELYWGGSGAEARLHRW